MYDKTEALFLPTEVEIENYTFRTTVDNYLGEGAFGYVYKGYNVTNPRHQVAIKSVSSEKLKRLELELLTKIKSEYLVKLLTVCSRGEITYIVMELCDGDLSGYLAKWSKLDVKNLTLLADNLARGYSVLQTHKIVHRDIKPQNILIKYKPRIGFSGKDEEPNKLEDREIAVAKLSDFGTSHLLTREDDELCNVAGTLFYMAPEVGANLVATNGYDHSADMWSIGCVLYESISGTTPFDENSLCRLFLHVACKNYHTFIVNSPSNNRDDLAANGQQFDYITNSLLRIDPKLRMTPQQFYERAISDMCKHSQKANVRHRFSVIGKDQNAHSKSFTYFNVNKNYENENENDGANHQNIHEQKHREDQSCTKSLGWKSQKRALSENRTSNRYNS